MVTRVEPTQRWTTMLDLVTSFNVVTAKTGEGIDALFTEMATSIISRKRNDFIPNAPTSSSSPTTIATQAPVEEKKGCCCYLGLFQTPYFTGGTEMVKYS